MTTERHRWPMSRSEAARIRESPSLEILGTSGSVNRVVESGIWGRVIDRRTTPSTFAPNAKIPYVIPQPHFEEDILRILNQAAVSFVPKIHYADNLGMIIEYMDGKVHTSTELSQAVHLRQWYADRSLDTMDELAAQASGIHLRTQPEMAKGYFWNMHNGPFGVTEHGDVLKLTLEAIWDRLLRGKETMLLAQIGSTESVSTRLRGLMILENRRRTSFLHNDFHCENVVDFSPVKKVHHQRFGVIDWTYASAGDLLWEATLIHHRLPAGRERRNFLEALHNRLPPAFLRGFESDWLTYQKILREKIRTMAAGVILKTAAAAVEATSLTKSDSAMRQVLLPYAERIHDWSQDFSEHPPEYPLEATLDILQRYVTYVIERDGGPYSHPRAHANFRSAPAGQHVRRSVLDSGGRRPLRDERYFERGKRKEL